MKSTERKQLKVRQRAHVTRLTDLRSL